MVFYRKYRPQTIEELDSPAVQKTLYSVLGDPQKTPHAFLFTGPKGLGKTSTARIVAKVVNCEARVKNKESGSKGKNNKEEHNSSLIIHNSNFVEPCNKCDQCLSIANGSNLDVMEIDAASNRGIDEIRDLREKIRLAPVSAKKKIYIIDEVHMLTTEAFNALLKTLEEPPSHVLFILCTTESHKVPATILSRCFHLQFRLATTEELVHSFTRMLEKEKISFEKDALVSVAALAEGSFRDGAKIIEECVALAEGQTLTKELVDEKFKVISIDHQQDALLHLLQQKDQVKALVLVNETVAMGVDMKYFIESLIKSLHASLLTLVGVTQETKKNDFSLEEIKQLVGILTQAYSELRFAVVPQLPLELAIVDWCNVTHNTPPKTDNKQATAVTPGTENKKLVTDNKQPTPENKQPITDTWIGFIDAVKQKDYTAAGLLRSCSLKESTKDAVVIQTQFAFHKKKLDEKVAMLADTWQQMTGNTVAITLELADKK